TEQVLGGNPVNPPASNEPNSGSLTEQFLGNNTLYKDDGGDTTTAKPGFLSGFGSGVGDVVHTVASGIGFLDRLINSDAKVDLDSGTVKITGPGNDRYN